MSEINSALPKTPLHNIADLLRGEFQAGKLHFYLFLLVLVTNLIFYSSAGYEIYVVAVILVFVFSYAMRNSENRVKRITSNTLFLLDVNFDLINSLLILIKFEMDLTAVFTLVIDLLALGVFTFFKLNRNSSKTL